MSTIPAWPTHFYVGEVKDHDKVVEAFMPYIIKEKEYFRDTWTLSRCSSSCGHELNDQMPWKVWWDAIQPNFTEYFEALGPTKPYTFELIECWGNIYHHGGFQEIHDHSCPDRMFACSYFFEYPDDVETGGELVIENTEFNRVTATGIDRVFKHFNTKCYIPKVKSGTIVIFPSWTYHFTNPNKSHKRRTTFSGNFKVREQLDPNSPEAAGSVEPYAHDYMPGANNA